MIEISKRPIESDFLSHVAYTRALEQYCNSLESQEPVGALTLGGIIDTSDGLEYEGWDVEWDAKVIEALQEKLVTSDSVEVMLYIHPPQRTEQEPVSDDIASILACRDMLDAQPVPEFDRVIWPERTEQEPLTFAGLAITEIRLPKGMTSRFEGGVLIIEAVNGITKGGDK